MSEFIFRNETEINKAKLFIDRGANKLNAFIPIVEDVMGKLNDKQKTLLLEKGLTFVEEHYKKQFQFPNADDQFNYKALGIDLSEINRYYKTHSGYWVSYVYELKDGIFVGKEDQPAITNHIQSADTEARKKLVEKCNKIIDLYNELKGTGVMYENGFFKAFDGSLFSYDIEKGMVLNKNMFDYALKRADRGEFKI